MQEAVALSLGLPVEARDTGHASGSGGAGSARRPAPMDVSETTGRFLEPEQAAPAAPAAEAAAPAAAAPAAAPPTAPVVQVVEPRIMLSGMPAAFHPAFGVVSPDPNVPLSAEYVARLQAMAHWWSLSAPDRARQLATGDLPFRARRTRPERVLGVSHIGNLISQLHHIAPVDATTDVGRAFQTVLDSLSVQEEMHRHLRHQLREIALQQGIESRQLRFRIMPDETYRRLRTRRTRRRLAAGSGRRSSRPHDSGGGGSPCRARSRGCGRSGRCPSDSR